MSLIGTTAVTQGPQGTVSSVVMEDERRILKSLRNIKDLLVRFNPSHTTKFSIKSLLTLVVENTFSEMRSGATDMLLQLEFDKAYSKRRATAVPNSNEFDPAVARLYHGSGFKRRI